MRSRAGLGIFAEVVFVNAADAQVVIPYGHSDSDFEMYLVATVSLAALVVAVWRYWRGRR